MGSRMLVVSGVWAVSCAVALSACSPTVPGTPEPSPTVSPTETIAPTATDGVATPEGHPIITSLAWNESSSEMIASGLVDGTLGDALECEFEFFHDGETVTRSSRPEPGPSSLDCGSVYVSVEELVPGEWSVVLVYGSARSDAQKVEVPS